MAENTKLASARMPTELRLEIWRYYFNIITIHHVQYHTLSKLEAAHVPFWSHPQLRDAQGRLIVQEPLLDKRQVPDLTAREPALLEMFRGEALPLYLERLEREKFEEIAAYRTYINRPMMNGLSFINDAETWIELRDKECRLVALTQGIRNVGQELEGASNDDANALPKSLGSIERKADALEEGDMVSDKCI